LKPIACVLLACAPILSGAMGTVPPAPSDVAAPGPGATRTPSGVSMKVLREGVGGASPLANDCVKVRFTAWKRDGALVATSGPRGEIATQCLVTAMPGVAAALTYMTEGEIRRIWLPSSQTVQPPAHSHHPVNHEHESMVRPDLTMDLELVAVLKMPPAPDDLRSPPPTSLKTRSGVMIQVLRKGQGTAHPAANSKVKVLYTGWTLDGRLFETTAASGQPATVLLGTALSGWREALPLMTAGEKARLWIPASVAYGDHPLDTSEPAGDLVFDVELVSFE